MPNFCSHEYNVFHVEIYLYFSLINNNRDYNGGFKYITKL